MFKPKRVMFPTPVIILVGLSCSDSELDKPILTADLPLHFEEHQAKDRINGAELSKAILEPAEWDFTSHNRIGS